MACKISSIHNNNIVHFKIIFKECILKNPWTLLNVLLDYEITVVYNISSN